MSEKTSKSETRQAFERMMLSGRINKLMNDGVQEGIAATEAVRKKWKPSIFMTPNPRPSIHLPDDTSDTVVPPEFRGKP